MKVTRKPFSTGDGRSRCTSKGKGFNGEGDMTFTLGGDRIASLVIP